MAEKYPYLKKDINPHIHKATNFYTQTHNGILFSLKKETVTNATTWINLEDIK